MAKERSHSYSAQTLVHYLINPLRHRLLSPQPTLLALRSLLDGILINHIAQCLAHAETPRPSRGGGWLEYR